MWAYTAKIAKICNFWYRFAQQGYTPLSVFLQYFAWGKEPQDRTVVPNFIAIALKMWPYGPQNRQKWYFLVKICPSEKIMGVNRKT